MYKEAIRRHFDVLAPCYDRWQQRNWFYHSCLRRFFCSLVPPASRVLEVGCATGRLLAQVAPEKGVGIEVSQVMVAHARSRYPHLTFLEGDIDTMPLAPLEGKFDYVILSNLIDYLPDITLTLQRVQSTLSPGGVLIITTENPLWQPLLKAASFFKLRMPEFHRNYITNADIATLVALAGLEVVKMGRKFFMPVYVPFLSALINFLVSEIPLFRNCCLMQYCLVRNPAPRQALTCSVIIPCHNEAENIIPCVRRVPAMGRETEIIVVDDGSTDDTADRARSLMHTMKQVHLVSYAKNRGKGHAVKCGCEAARGDVLMILDADMSVRPEELPQFLRPLQEGVADFVNGTRMVYPMQGQAMRALNYFGNKCFNLILSWLMEQRVSDTLCGTKALFRRDFSHIAMGRCRWGDFDLLFGIARLRRKIIELPVHYQRRIAGTSKMRILRHGWLLARMCWVGFLELKVLHVQGACAHADAERKRMEQAQGVSIQECAQQVWGWSSPAGRKRVTRRIDEFRRRGVPSGSMTLEIGCGVGTFTERLCRHPTRLVAIDISYDLLHRARKRLPTVTFIQADAERLPFKEGVFTSIVGVSILHHLVALHAAREIYRVLGVGARAVFSEPNMANPQVLLQKKAPFINRLSGDVATETAFLKGRLLRLLRGAGFQSVEVRPFEFLHPATPVPLITALTQLERALERIPLIREIAGSLLISVQRK